MNHIKTFGIVLVCTILLSIGAYTYAAPPGNTNKHLSIVDGNGTFIGYSLRVEDGSGSSNPLYTAYVPSIDGVFSIYSFSYQQVLEPVISDIYYDQANCIGSAYLLSASQDAQLQYGPQWITSSFDRMKSFKGSAALPISGVNVQSFDDEQTLTCQNVTQTIDALPLTPVTLPFDLSALQWPLSIVN